jgi:hypothetical protein
LVSKALDITLFIPINIAASSLSTSILRVIKNLKNIEKIPKNRLLVMLKAPTLVVCQVGTDEPPADLNLHRQYANTSKYYALDILIRSNTSVEAGWCGSYSCR